MRDGNSTLIYLPPTNNSNKPHPEDPWRGKREVVHISNELYNHPQWGGWRHSCQGIFINQCCWKEVTLQLSYISKAPMLLREIWQLSGIVLALTCHYLYTGDLTHPLLCWYWGWKYLHATLSWDSEQCQVEVRKVPLKKGQVFPTRERGFQSLGANVKKALLSVTTHNTSDGRAHREVPYMKISYETFEVASCEN